MRRSRQRAGVCAAILLAAAAAAAHEQTTSYSTWEIRGREVDVTARLSLLDLSRYPWSNAAPAERDRRAAVHLTEHLSLRAGDTPCRIAGAPRPLAGSRARLVFAWRLECAGSGPLRLRSDLLLDVAPSHLHFARVTLDGRPALERVLSDAEREWTLAAPGDERAAPSGSSIATYLALGIEHILPGYDHLAFVAALLLIGGSLSEVARIVTGFTVAHSVTLALAVLGYVRPDPAPVEALIGLSIALVAAENLWHSAGRGISVPVSITAVLGGLAIAAAFGRGAVPPLTMAGLALFAACYFALLRRAERTAPLRSAVAFLFGLLHGFGFAGVLLEAELPAARIGQALFSFNLGVELGQLAVVAALWPMLRLVARRGGALHRAVVDYASAAILVVGMYWFVSRAFS